VRASVAIAGPREGHVPVAESQLFPPEKKTEAVVTLYQPATAHSNAIVRPNCTSCGTPTLLFGIEAADRPGYELQTFVCPDCKHVETAVGKIE
jgi:hypothetical protein